MFKWTTLLPALALGVVVGAFSGLLGIGGGVFMVPAMIYFWPRDFTEPKLAIATSLAVMVPTALVATLKNHFAYHSVNWPMAIMLAVGAIAGTFFFGTTLAHSLPGDTVKKIFGVLLLVVGLQLLGVGTWLSKVL